MLKTTAISTAKKTAGCAVTYRAGNKEKFGTCPKSCELNPSGRGCKLNQIDFNYLDALLDAKPKRGESFTYSHFHPIFWAHMLSPKKTVINYSAANPETALLARQVSDAPVVTVVPQNYFENGKNKTLDGVRFIRCPAEYNSAVTCNNCGGDKAPLCARLDRNFIVTFTAHGAAKRKAGTSERGGCYADGGNVNIHWQNTAKQKQQETDGDRLRAFVKTLPANTIIRHHVAGDIGLDTIGEMPQYEALITYR